MEVLNEIGTADNVKELLTALRARVGSQVQVTASSKYEQAAAEKILANDPEGFFAWEIYKRHPEMGRKAARIFLHEGSNDPWDVRHFFRLMLHKTYPEMGKPYAEFIAKQAPEWFFDKEMHDTYPEAAAAITVDEELGVRPDNVKENNFYSLTRSQFQTEQRHPKVAGLDRYDFAINNPLGSEQSDLENNILANLQPDAGEGHSSIGIPGYTKSFALVAFPEPNVLFLEQVQSDIPPVLSYVSDNPESAEDIKKEYGEKAYFDFIEKYTKFSQAYPYITIKKAAEMAMKSDIVEIRMSDAETMLSVADIKNRKKADRIYDIIPNKLGFSKRFTEQEGFWSYTGDMQELYEKAAEMERKVMGQKKQVSKRDTPAAVNMEALKSDVSQLMGKRVDELDFSGGAREFAKSVNMLKDVSNKNKKQLMGLINKHIKAYIIDMLTKIGEREQYNIKIKTNY